MIEDQELKELLTTAQTDSEGNLINRSGYVQEEGIDLSEPMQLFYGRQKNRPLNKREVKGLPMGFTPTTMYPNRKMRRQMGW